VRSVRRHATNPPPTSLQVGAGWRGARLVACTACCRRERCLIAESRIYTDRPCPISVDHIPLPFIAAHPSLCPLPSHTHTRFHYKHIRSAASTTIFPIVTHNNRYHAYSVHLLPPRCGLSCCRGRGCSRRKEQPHWRTVPSPHQGQGAVRGVWFRQDRQWCCWKGCHH
jgi:hypothetical protein